MILLEHMSHQHQQGVLLLVYGVRRTPEAEMGTIIVDLLRIKGDRTLPQRNIANLIVNLMIETVITAQPHSIHGILSILLYMKGLRNQV
jgi:hypothetical protein